MLVVGSHAAFACACWLLSPADLQSVCGVGRLDYRRLDMFHDRLTYGLGESRWYSIADEPTKRSELDWLVRGYQLVVRREALEVGRFS
ncbi:hypothetical protein BA062_34060 [Prauserella flavalba]|uniref:Uncharacterized protein n=1 Tax=Prauserella flavalba TaxID=1477506 RepID=A0A318LBJ4_9PSEU|nr:hypothetical protein BA062_34060 [Prauserella flavalba]